MSHLSILFKDEPIATLYSPIIDLRELRHKIRCLHLYTKKEDSIYKRLKIYENALKSRKQKPNIDSNLT